MSFNNLVVEGRLTRDPKVVSKEGAEKTVVSMSLASNYSEKVGTEYEEKVQYIEFPAFGKQAENCMKYLAKGSRVLVSGRVTIRTWESNGKAGHNLYVLPNEITFLEMKKKEDGDAPF